MGEPKEGTRVAYENVLLQKLRESDESAFTTIFSTYYTDLVRFATGYTKNTDVAEEIVQEIFVKLWEDRKVVEIISSLKSYLLKMVQNKCLDWLRHLKVRDKYAGVVTDLGQTFDYDTENFLLFSELEQKIDAALAVLPDENKQVFKLNRYEGFKYHEIAEKLNLSVRVVELRMSKALQILREQLKDYLPAIIAFYYFLKH